MLPTPARAAQPLPPLLRAHAPLRCSFGSSGLLPPRRSSLKSEPRCMNLRQRSAAGPCRRGQAGMARQLRAIPCRRPPSAAPSGMSQPPGALPNAHQPHHSLRHDRQVGLGAAAHEQHDAAHSGAGAGRQAQQAAQRTRRAAAAAAGEPPGSLPDRQLGRHVCVVPSSLAAPPTCLRDHSSLHHPSAAPASTQHPNQSTPSRRALGVAQRCEHLHFGPEPLLAPLVHRQQQLDGNQCALQPFIRSGAGSKGEQAGRWQAR